MIQNKPGVETTKPFQQLEPIDMVKITSSPFKNMLAIFEGPTTTSDRVYVLFASLNNSVRLRIAPSNLEKVSGRVSTPVNMLLRHSRGRGRLIN
jgi:transcription antitermination factor NusG